MKQALVMIFELAGLLLIPQLANAQPVTDKLSGWIHLQPEENSIRANVTYQYVNGLQAKSQLTFYLDKHVKVTHLACPKLKGFTLKRDKSSPLADFMNTLFIQLQEPLQKNEQVTIALSYQANLPLNLFGDIPLPKNWIEISFNSLSLTPVRVELSPATYKLEIRADPAYKVFSAGQVTTSGRGSTRIQSEIATLGVNCILGKDLQVETITRKNNIITLVSDKASDSLKLEVAAMTDWCLDYYNHTFGSKTAKRQVTLALRPVKELDASYAVGEDYFVTYDSKEDFFQRKPFHFGNISHEIGHFWWHHADFTTNHIWLNEGFAEYVSLMAIRVYFGKDEFEKQIESLKTKVAKLPDTLSLANYDAQGRFGTAMSYNAGALMLHQLEERIGEVKFVDLLAKVAELKIKTSQEFIKVVERVLGVEEAHQVEKDIRNE
jgi:hypothetical protein